MITYSIIQKSQLGYTNRIDTEYYQPIFLELENNLRKFKSEALDRIALVGGGKRLPAGEIFSDSGIPYVRIVDIYNTFIDIDNVELISNRLHELLEHYQIKQKDILVTIVGNTVGLVGYNQLNLDKLNFTENCARIRSKTLFAEYLLVAFLSQIGQLQVLREKVGTAQPKLSLDRLRKFLIPVASENFQKMIKCNVDDSINCINDSKNFYQSAENLLLEELGLESFEIKDDLSYIVNLSEVKSAKREDAEYFQPKYEMLISKIKNRNTKPILEVIENIPPNFNPYLKSDDTFKYVELANINSSSGVINGYSEMLGKEVPSRAKRILKSGDVIVSSVQGSLEKVALVDKKYEGSLASTGFFQFRSKDILSEVLLVLAKSIVLQMQLEKQCAGTILAAVSKEALKEIVLPILQKETQQKIANLVKQSHEALKKSKELLEEAKRKVEEMIEKGGE